MAFKLKVGPAQGIKLKGNSGFSFPMIGGAGITAVKSGGLWTVSLDFSEFQDATVLNDDTAYILTWDSSSGVFTRLSVTDFKADFDGEFATPAQGALADSAVQPGDLGALALKDQADVPGDLNATGTPDSTKFLRGDGAWSVVGGSGVSSIAGNTGAFTLANGIDNSTNQIQLTAARRTLPTTQVFTSGSGTYTRPSNCLWIEVEMVGGGGGGGGSGTSPGATGNGGTTTFGSALLTANGGAGANTSAGGAGGSATGGLLNKTGATGGNGSGLTNQFGGAGAAGPYGGGGGPGQPNQSAGVAATSNSGAGGGGGGDGATINSGGGGGAGGYLRAIINSPASSYAYAVGAGGTAGTAGTGGVAGGAGGSGVIIVTEHYGS